MRVSLFFRLVLVACALTACGRADASFGTRASAAPDSLTTPAPAGYVDSIFPPEEELRRFQAGLENPGRLAGGAESRDALVRRFVRAVEARDTAAVREMVVSRAEFAWLYFPESRYTRPPTVTKPGLVWFLSLQESEKGIGRLLERRGGRPLGYAGHRCAPEPVVEGDNRLWDCSVTLRDEGGTKEWDLFGPILERGGRFKFLSYKNDL